MSERPIIVANWKLGLDYNQSIALAREIANDAPELTKHAHLILSPSAIAIHGVVAEFGDPVPVSFAAQNICTEVTGAFTGETSIAAVQQLGCRYVIVGHSERRQKYGETDEQVAKKIRLVFEFGLIPVLCVGETYEERQSGQAEIIVEKQLQKGLSKIQMTENQQLMVAYEPIWAIGTGQAIHPDQARMMAMVVHQQMVNMFPEPVAKNAILLYGGSVDSHTISTFVDRRVIRGVIVGGASQNFDDFRALVLALANK